MSTQHDNDLRNQQAVEPCWKTVGVSGDGTCPELARAVHCRNCSVFTNAGQQLFEREPPAEYVAKQTALLAEELDEEAAGSEAMIVFRIEEEWLALDVAAVVEVAEPRPVHRVPHRSDRLLMGIANIRGELQLCISLRALLGIEGADHLSESSSQTLESERSAYRLLVCENRGRRWAFAVDEVTGVHRARIDQLGNVPSTIGKSVNRLVGAVFTWEDKSIGRLDTNRLFDSLEERIG